MGVVGARGMALDIAFALQEKWLWLNKSTRCIVTDVGARNSPPDPGRVPMSPRFLRHAPLVIVDYPGEISLKK